MKNKEDRLSPRAKRLLEDARRKFSTSPRAAMQYLQSVNPEEFTMYDRQKIGREILARAPPTSILFDVWALGKFLNKIEEAYGLPITRWSSDFKKYEQVEPLIGKARILRRQSAVKCEREMARHLSAAIEEEKNGSEEWASYDGITHRRGIYDSFEGAIRAYSALGKTEKVIECYDMIISSLEKGLVGSIDFSQRYFTTDSIGKLKEERDGLLKKTG